MQKYVFIVGKADPLQASVQAIRQAGYLVGIFLDNQLVLKNPDVYDLVVPVPFTDLTELDMAELSRLPIAGLVCTYENYIVAKAQLAAALGLPSVSVDSARLCTDKLLMRQAFAAYDPAISPAFQEVTSAAQAAAFTERCGFPVIIKPASLVKSLLVIRCDTPRQLLESTNHALSQLASLYKKYRVFDREPKLIIEQFMEGQLYSVAAFADRQGKPVICPGITALVNAGQVGFDDNFLYSRVLPATLDPQLEARLYKVARQAMQALDLRSTPAHVELIHTSTDEVKIIEVGARIGGYRPRMYRLSYGLDLLAMEIDTATDSPLRSAAAPQTSFTAVYELFPHAAGTFAGLEPAGVVTKLPELAHSTNIKVKPGAICGPAKDGYKAAAVIMVHDQNYDTFRLKCTAVEQIKVRLR